MGRKPSRRSVRSTQQSQDTAYEYDTPSVVREYREKHAPLSVNRHDKKARREYMVKNPETLVVVEEFEDISLDKSGVLASGSYLSMFYTKRADAWIQTCRNFYKNSNLHVDEISDSNGIQLRMKRNKKDGDLLYALSFGKTGFVNVQGREHEAWGETDFYALHSMIGQDVDRPSTDVSHTQDETVLSQSQVLFTSAETTVDPTAHDGTQSQSLGLHLSPTQTDQPAPVDDSVTFTQASHEMTGQSESDLSQSIPIIPLINPAGTPVDPPMPIPSGSSGSIDITSDSKDNTVLSQSQKPATNNISENTLVNAEMFNSTINMPPTQSIADKTVPEPEFPPLSPPTTTKRDVTLEDVTDSDDKPSYASIVDNRATHHKSPTAQRVSSTPARGNGVPLHNTASPITNNSAQEPSPSSHATPSSKPPPTPPPVPPVNSPIFFRIRGSCPWLSNLYQHEDLTKFEVFDDKWKSKEHPYQWRKAIFFEEWAMANAIKAAPTAEEAMALGSQIGGSKDMMDKWDAKKLRVMNDIHSAFCEQQDWFVDKLISTGNRELCEDTAHSEWGALGRGQNWLGKILMTLRRDYLMRYHNSTPKPSHIPLDNITKEPPKPTKSSSGGKKFLFFGDSMSYELPLDIPGYECKVTSHSGARVTTPKMARRSYVSTITRLKQDMDGDESHVGLLIGANDVPHTNVAKFTASYRALVRTAKSNGATVLCYGIFHRGDRRDLNGKIDVFNNAIHQVAREEKCVFINNTSHFHSTAQYPNLDILVGGRLHLKAWVKRAMANRLSTAVCNVDTECDAQRQQPTAPRHTTAPQRPHKAPKPQTKGSHHRRKTQNQPSRQGRNHEQYDPIYNLDSCYRPNPAFVHHNQYRWSEHPGTVRDQQNTRWQQYPPMAGYQGRW